MCFLFLSIARFLLAWLLQFVYAAMSLAAVVNLALVYGLLFVPEYIGLFPQRTWLHKYARRWEDFVQVGALLSCFLDCTDRAWLLFARSTYLPRWLGWLLIADGFAWVIDRLTEYVARSTSLSFLDGFFVGEMVLMVWLLGLGTEIERAKPHVRTRGSLQTYSMRMYPGEHWCPTTCRSFGNRRSLPIQH